MTAGIVGWGTYLPYWRLQRQAIGTALGGPAGRGTRAVAAHDQDTTTLGVEAGRVALSAPGTPAPGALLFSTPAPAYLDKSNATALAAALGLPGTVGAYDLLGAPRSSVAALQSALALGESGPVMAVAAELRTGLAGSAEERDSGDGAAAVLCGPEGAVAELVGVASGSGEVLERWRGPEETGSHVWEERFGEEVAVPLVLGAWADALKAAGAAVQDVAHVAVTGLAPRAVRTVKARLGVPSGTVVDDRAAIVGNLGAAALLFALGDVLDRAGPGELVALVHIGDGADVLLLRTTPALLDAQRARRDAGVPTASAQIASGRDDLEYTRFLTWRGQLRREPPRRPDPERPGAPTMWRSEGWKYGFAASRCTECGFLHLPPTRVCLRCRAVDRMVPEAMADRAGTVATFTVDHLAYSPSPPVVGVVVDFDGGGRYRCEMTDVDPDALRIGTRVAMTFRRVYSAQGVHNYFWKAAPVEGASGTGEAGDAGDAGDAGGPRPSGRED